MTFKLSKYSTFFKNNNKTFLHSYSTKNNVEVDDKTLDFLNDYSFQRIDREILDNLIQNDILVPDFIQEEHLICEQLTQGSKYSKSTFIQGGIEEWRSVTIDNIDFLLNHKMPANVVNYEGILNKISDKLKYFMLMGVVDDLIINILKNDFKEGYNIIEQVQVRDISIPINKQIQDWVILNIGISKGQVGNEFKKDYHTFMKSSNDIANLTSMKLFLRNRIKKKFKYIYQELNVK